jgi:hypothetical protein
MNVAEKITGSRSHRRAEGAGRCAGGAMLIVVMKPSVAT